MRIPCFTSLDPWCWEVVQLHSFAAMAFSYHSVGLISLCGTWWNQYQLECVPDRNFGVFVENSRLLSSKRLEVSESSISRYCDALL